MTNETTNKNQEIANAVKKVTPVLMEQTPWQIAQNTFKLCRDTESKVLKNWAFKKSRAKMRYGYCNYRTKTLSVSTRLLEHASKEQIIDTVLHEVAHALAGRGTGHGPKWKNVARELGAKPNACGGASYDKYDEWFDSHDFKYVRTCPNGCVIGHWGKVPVYKIGLFRKSRTNWTCECGETMELNPC